MSDLTSEMQHYITLRIKSRNNQATPDEIKEMEAMRYTFTDQESHVIREALGTNGLIVGGK